jgi:erythronate-4-phosphate dehydrogenase
VKIVADENIPYVQEAFGTLGKVIALPGRKIGSRAVREADMLLVRSITQVNAMLLEGSHIRFVGTATIGTDHVDEECLRSRGIAFASAPGSNANSVAEYIVAALLTLAKRRNFRVAGKTIGVIGVGNCGSRFVKKAEALGINVLLNDPPLWRQTGHSEYRPIEELFGADVVTLHVPLTYEGVDATCHLVDEAFLRQVRPGAIVVNTSRGGVVDGRALKEGLDSGKIGGAVLDVWENEPNIDLDLLDRVEIGTPHIAGYSFDGKVNATAMLYEAASKFLGVEKEWDAASCLPEPDCARIEVWEAAQAKCLTAPGIPAGEVTARVVHSGASDEDTIAEIVRLVYDAEKDDDGLRKVKSIAENERGAFFDNLRKEYPVRREFHNTEVVLPESLCSLAEALSRLGFRARKQEAVGRCAK